MHLIAKAKINLKLEVYKRKTFRKLHRIMSIFCIVDDLEDHIFINKSDNNEDTISTNFPLKKNNPIINTIRLLRKNKILDHRINLLFVKNIPTYAGLGGFSSVCATICRHYCKDLDDKKRNKIYKKLIKLIGTDCAFFLSGHNLAKVCGYGTKIEKLDRDFKVSKEDLIFTNINCKTNEVYKEFDRLKAWNLKNINMLTSSILSLYQELKEYYNEDENFFTGSGSTLVKKKVIDQFYL